jgi:endonuclease/exonuclease/phosphatase family metal-dependent hydrolase
VQPIADREKTSAWWHGRPACSSEAVTKSTQHRRPSYLLRQTTPIKLIGTPPVGILSKYPIVSSEILHLAGHRETQQRAIIKFNEQEVVIYNMQATGPWFKIYNILRFLKIPVYKYSPRSPEIQDLVQRVERELLPVIVADDFNMTDESQDYDRVQKVMQDAFRKFGFGFGFTWPHGWELKLLIKRSNWRLNYPVCRIDYIWYSKPWDAKSSSVLEATESDCLPSAAELILLTAARL